MQHERQNMPPRQETENDPSSSSMSGYDFRGMLSRVRNQANYVQNNVLKTNGTDVSPKNDALDDNYRH